ncbi:LacI family DNA-binding transcriptional regulator [Microvirga pudoricolor]|uniref:LacI family DNA-binding transcriptional regulator n=1 Tax=Microvirga pudoricolor TaxID=2778729 RepID=UPI0019503D35|nr:LacI family DNA-binding transcriptional regulator [Microvirga pudoricolor]MBM6594381.1 LacI family DNA-binding transcriptional regulator [Microvirga pudoricolor]
MTKQRPLRQNPVSLATVASAAGVSMATVSRIVNGETRRASAETVERVQKVVAALGYRPNHIGRTLRRRESRIVAMLSPNLDNPAMAAIADSVETALRSAGYVMILCDTHDRADLQDEYLHAMRSQVVQGYVVVNAVRSEGLSEAVSRGDPVVFVGRRNPDGGGSFVGIDNRGAGADAADHLWARGIRDLALIHPSQGSSATRDRVEGFVTRLTELGCPRPSIRSAAAPGLRHLEAGYAAVRALVEGEAGRQDWPAGLFCPSDLMAYGAYRFAQENGIRIPQDCRFVGVDDNALNAWIAPWLTSVHIPYVAFGEKVVDQLKNLWAGEGPSEDLLPHELIVRQA